MNKRRPIRFNPDHGDLARKFCMLGATNEDLARLLEVPRQTINPSLRVRPAMVASADGARR